MLYYSHNLCATVAPMILLCQSDIIVVSGFISIYWLTISVSLGSIHSTIHYYESYPVGMQLPVENQLDFFPYFLIQVCNIFSSTVSLSSCTVQPTALTIKCNLCVGRGSMGTHGSTIQKLYNPFLLLGILLGSI